MPHPRKKKAPDNSGVLCRVGAHIVPYNTLVVRHPDGTGVCRNCVVSYAPTLATYWSRHWPRSTK